MRFNQSSNPMFNNASFERSFSGLTGSQSMTIGGTVNKTLVLTLLVFAGAVYSWFQPSTLMMLIGGIGGFIMALVTIYRPHQSGITAPIYAVLEGLFLGSVSNLYAGAYSGIVFQAITLTISVLFIMLFLYRSGIIKVTQRLRMGIVAATGAIFFMYLINFILGFFDIAFYTAGNFSLMAIGINLVIVGVAAFNLLLDFDFIERGAQQGAPKYMEWYGAFGLMVTLVWLYLELLRLLARLAGRD